MATFDRFDICAAYNIYYVNYNGEAYTNALGCRLSALKYKPAHSEEYLCGLNENAREIYEGLVREHHPEHTGYVACACCRLDTMGVEGVAMCGYCESAGCEPDCAQEGCPNCRGHECQSKCSACGMGEGECECEDGGTF